MIKVNELRIGNLVYKINRSGKIHLPELPAFKVLSIGIFKAEILLPNINPCNVFNIPKVAYFDLSPIPLTEEILLKCGFEKVASCWCFGSFTLGTKKNNESTPYFTTSSYLIEIISVHQLQNLYFILTGNELTISI